MHHKTQFGLSVGTLVGEGTCSKVCDFTKESVGKPCKGHKCCCPLGQKPVAQAKCCTTVENPQPEGQDPPEPVPVVPEPELPEPELPSVRLNPTSLRGGENPRQANSSASSSVDPGPQGAPSSSSSVPNQVVNIDKMSLVSQRSDHTNHLFPAVKKQLYKGYDPTEEAVKASGVDLDKKPVNFDPWWDNGICDDPKYGPDYVPCAKDTAHCCLERYTRTHDKHCWEGAVLTVTNSLFNEHNTMDDAWDNIFHKEIPQRPRIVNALAALGHGDAYDDGKVIKFTGGKSNLEVLHNILRTKGPIIAGLGTGGDVGHYVVIAGIDVEKRQFNILDPWNANFGFKGKWRSVPANNKVGLVCEAGNSRVIMELYCPKKKLI